jgi:superfamily II DNA/RNA helicase
MPPTFAQLGVPPFIVDALARRGITEPFEIQAATIADALAGRDVCGRAPTGSGKTLAFGIPLVATVDRAQTRRPRALVLAPTRELAEQITTELRSFAGDVRIAAVYGGVGYGPQINALRKGVDVLVACPGRLEDLIQQGDVELGDVDKVVLDEADRMADMGFMPAVRRLLDATHASRQTVLFSATLDGDVAKLTRDYQRDPVRHEVGEETPDITAAHHVFWQADKAQRTELTAEAINAVWPTIVFCRTRHGSDRLTKQLSRSDIKAVAIHGGRSQGQRTRALADFAAGRVHALIATDVAARGIHVDGVAQVIHFDPPEDHKTYVHRSGRTARAGEGGVVLSLVQPDQRKDTRRLQREVDLDEPISEPDAGALRDLSNAPVRQLAPALPGGDGSRSDGSRAGGQANASRRGGGQGRRGQGGGRRQGQGGNGQAKNGRRGGGGGQAASGEGAASPSGSRSGGGRSGANKSPTANRKGRRTQAQGNRAG